MYKMSSDDRRPGLAAHTPMGSDGDRWTVPDADGRTHTITDGVQVIESVPTLSQWELIALTMLMPTGLTLLLARRRDARKRLRPGHRRRMMDTSRTLFKCLMALAPICLLTGVASAQTVNRGPELGRTVRAEDSQNAWICRRQDGTKLENCNFDPAAPPAGVECVHPTLYGTRMKEGEVYDCDCVFITSASAEVTIALLDDSRVTVRADPCTNPPLGKFQVKVGKLKRTTREGQTLGRRIKVEAGKVFSVIRSLLEGQSPECGDVETPVGCAGVRGTVLKTTVCPPDDASSVAVYEGLVDVTVHALPGATFTLTGGTSAATMVFDATGVVETERPLTPAEITEIEQELSDPISFFTWTPKPALRMLPTQFRDWSHPGLFAPIVSYAWSFSDGGASTERDPQHTFQILGEHEVTLTVTDADGRTHTITDGVQVIEPVPTLSQWGLIALTMLMLIGLTILLARHGKPAIAGGPRAS